MAGEWRLTADEARAAGSHGYSVACVDAQARKLWALAWPDIEQLRHFAEHGWPGRNPPALLGETIQRLEALAASLGKEQ